MGKLILIFLLVGFVGMAVGTLCPDQKSRCPNAYTCCKVSTGYGCCRFTDATCCEDGLHCCPSHLACDVVHSRCVPQTRIPFPFSMPVEAWKEIGQTTLLRVETEPKSQTCPDGRQKCPDVYTCCSLIGGGYGCCRETDAVCCADGVHCCPKNTTCNLDSGSCDS